MQKQPTTGNGTALGARVKVSDIKVPEGQQKDLGDIDELADNIGRNGLVQPLVLASDLTLVAG